MEGEAPTSHTPNKWRARLRRAAGGLARRKICKAGRPLDAPARRSLALQPVPAFRLCLRASTDGYYCDALPALIDPFQVFILPDGLIFHVLLLTHDDPYSSTLHLLQPFPAKPQRVIKNKIRMTHAIQSLPQGCHVGKKRAPDQTPMGLPTPPMIIATTPYSNPLNPIVGLMSVPTQSKSPQAPPTQHRFRPSMLNILLFRSNLVSRSLLV